MIRKILLALLAVFVLIQFIRPEKNVSEGVSPNDITTKYDVPADVHAVLKRSCFDCHSNNTVYPWYSNIQPAGWFLNSHIQEGKRKLNFSEFTTYPAKKADHKLEEVAEAVTEGWMPLGSYLAIHTDAKLTTDEAKRIADWANNLRSQIKVPVTEGQQEEHELH